MALGVIFSFLIGATAAALISWIGIEIRQIHKLANVETIHDAADAMAREGHGGALGFIAEARRMLRIGRLSRSGSIGSKTWCRKL